MTDARVSSPDLLDEVERLRARVAALEAQVRGQRDELVAAQDAYHALASYSLQGILILQNGRVAFAGPGIQGLTGYGAEEFGARAGFYLAGLVHPDDYSDLRLALAEYGAGTHPPGEPEQYEARIRLSDGQYRPFVLALQGLTHQDQPAVQVTLIDVRDLREAENALREREDLFRRTFDQSPVGAAIVDRELHFVRVNHTLCSITGYTEADLKARSLLDITHPYDQDTARDLWMRLIDGAIDYFTMEQRYVRPDGGTVWVHLSVRMLEDAEGRRQHALPLMEDITARKQAEAELHRSEQKYRRFVEQSADAIWLFDAEGRTLEWNRGAELLTGLTRNQVIGQLIWDVLGMLGSDAAAQVMLDRVRAGLAAFMDQLPSEQSFSLAIRHVDGKQRQTQMLVFPIFGDEELLLGAITRDNTERLRAEQDALQLHLEKGRVEMLTTFIRDASHEFRTPLSVINTNLYVLRRLLSGDMLQERLDVVEEQTRYLHELLESMLTVSRLSSKAEWNFDSVPVGRLIDALHTRVLPMAEESGVAFRVRAPGNLPSLECDEIELFTALLNILTNAVQYTPMPGEVELRVSQSNDFLHFAVSDTGVGIPAEALPHVFERFYRVDAARTQPGAGLGLCIAQLIVERHGGTISAQSVVGKGSTFTVSVPVSGHF